MLFPALRRRWRRFPPAAPRVLTGRVRVGHCAGLPTVSSPPEPGSLEPKCEPRFKRGWGSCGSLAMISFRRCRAPRRDPLPSPGLIKPGVSRYLNDVGQLGLGVRTSLLLAARRFGLGVRTSLLLAARRFGLGVRTCLLLAAGGLGLEVRTCPSPRPGKLASECEPAPPRDDLASEECAPTFSPPGTTCPPSVPLHSRPG